MRILYLFSMNYTLELSLHKLPEKVRPQCLPQLLQNYLLARVKADVASAMGPLLAESYQAFRSASIA
jgi:hypothetical protein